MLMWKKESSSNLTFELSTKSMELSKFKTATMEIYQIVKDSGSKLAEYHFEMREKQCMKFRTQN